MNKDTRKSQIIASVAGLTLVLLTGVLAASNALGISSGLATNLYFVLNGVSWAFLVAGIIAGMGITSVGVGVVMKMFKKLTMRQFIAW